MSGASLRRSGGLAPYRSLFQIPLLPSLILSFPYLWVSPSLPYLYLWISLYLAFYSLSLSFPPFFSFPSLIYGG